MKFDNGEILNMATEIAQEVSQHIFDYGYIDFSSIPDVEQVIEDVLVNRLSS